MTINDLIVALRGAEEIIGTDANVFVIDAITNNYYTTNELFIKFMDKSVEIEVSI